MTSASWAGDPSALEALGSLLIATGRRPDMLKHARLHDLVCAGCNGAPGWLVRTSRGTVLVTRRAADGLDRALVTGDLDGWSLGDDKPDHRSVWHVELWEHADEFAMQCRCRDWLVSAAPLRAELAGATRRRFLLDPLRHSVARYR